MDPSFLKHLLLKEKFNNCRKSFSHNPTYYGNVCRECFKSENLKKCSSCKIVSYCSKEHQLTNWPIHKLFCKAYKTASEEVEPLAKDCSFEDFVLHRKNIGMKLENNIPPVLHRYINEMYQFPWVCSVCFSTENLDYECVDCKSVVYCSLEHLNQNMAEHKINCPNLKLCKLFDSVTYENGFKLKLMKFRFETVPRKLKHFPKTMNEMSCLIQKQLVHTKNMHDVMNLTIHNDLYAAAATILYAFNAIGLLHDRVITGKPFLSKHKRESLLAQRMAEVIACQLQGTQRVEINPAMVIHFVVADVYEVNFQWTAFIAILTHWMLNIDYIEVILVGQDLEKCDEKPDFRDLIARSGCQFHAKSYKNIVKHLPKPDLVVLYNSNQKNSSEVDDHEFQRTLFKYKRTPLLITSTKIDKLNSLVETLMNLPNVQVLLDSHKNPFADSKPYRIWDEKCISTYVKNDFLTVLTRH